MAIISLKIDDDILEAFKADGRGYQQRMNQALRDSLLPIVLKPFQDTPRLLSPTSSASTSRASWRRSCAERSSG
jgi:hypothetical protein